MRDGAHICTSHDTTTQQRTAFGINCSRTTDRPARSHCATKPEFKKRVSGQRRLPNGRRHHHAGRLPAISGARRALLLLNAGDERSPSPRHDGGTTTKVKTFSHCKRLRSMPCIVHFAFHPAELDTVWKSEEELACAFATRPTRDEAVVRGASAVPRRMAKTLSAKPQRACSKAVMSLL